ncbi:MAG: ABC transporter ATP-binding protein [Pseudomonadota bacterium]|nr:ABC transporter ATP-binding protein [Pseudomonadota bacterium]
MTYAIEIEDLRKTYRSRGSAPVQALDGVSFQVPQGRIYGLLGPNGAGKSTLVRIISTITLASSGRAAVRGFDVAREPLQARRQMAVVVQQAAENLLTVRDNLLIYAYLHGMARSVAEKRLNAVAAEFELGGRLRDTVQELSIGTKRRIQVAKIFMLDAPIIILDEATTGMDPLRSAHEAARDGPAARRGPQRANHPLTTQVLSEAEELCETIMILNHGRTMASGTLLELRKRAAHTFRVSLSFAHTNGELVGRLEALRPLELRVNGSAAEMLFHGEEASLLGKLADISRDTPILQFEVRGPTLEEIFVSLMRDSP